MKYGLEVHNTKKINVNRIQAFFETMYIGRLFNLEINHHKLFPSIAQITKYLTGNQHVQTVKRSQVRFVQDRPVIGGRFCTYYQLYLPNITNCTQYDQVRLTQRYADFLENMNSYNEIDIFYTETNEDVSHFEHYFNQLDTLRSSLSTRTQKGEELSDTIRSGLGKYIQIIQERNYCRTRKAYLIISQSCNSANPNTINISIEDLHIKESKVEEALKAIDILYKKLNQDELHHLFSNHITNPSL